MKTYLKNRTLVFFALNQKSRFALPVAMWSVTIAWSSLQIEIPSLRALVDAPYVALNSLLTELYHF